MSDQHSDKNSIGKVIDDLMMMRREEAKGVMVMANSDDTMFEDCIRRLKEISVVVPESQQRSVDPYSWNGAIAAAEAACYGDSENPEENPDTWDWHMKDYARAIGALRLPVATAPVSASGLRARQQDLPPEDRDAIQRFVNTQGTPVSTSGPSGAVCALLQSWRDFLHSRWTGKGFDHWAQELDDKTRELLEANPPRSARQERSE